MLSAPTAASRAARTVCALSTRSRRLATHVPAVASAASSSTPSSDGPLRPHLGIEVNPEHGLYAFFRKKEKDGKPYYDTVEPMDMTADQSGRAWTAAELRRKSFKDLHTLWYVVLRERNLLATQQAEARRMGANEQTLGLWAKAFRCRKTMARIKYVINERRLAYEGAMKIYGERREEALEADKIARKEAEEAERKRVAKEWARKRSNPVEDMVTRSLFETVPETVGQKA
ncbi:mitochondrial 39-S ribosomal protein L47 (MRP-L47)-domain-containing protein [Dichomitus squalens]|nr:mitochondrial 39-S ribosomal protein L47 (MRP-L47)-domain-containing protein [Dichomitus squalens]